MLQDLHCKECGAAPRGMKLCHDLFDDLLGIKYSGTGEAYRLALACYTFQHPKSHSPRAWSFARRYLEAVVVHGIHPRHAKEHAQILFDQAPDEETYSPLQDQPSLPWTRTISDYNSHFLNDPLEDAITWATESYQCYEQWEANRHPSTPERNQR